MATSDDPTAVDGVRGSQITFARWIVSPARDIVGKINVMNAGNALNIKRGRTNVPPTASAH